MTVWSCYARVSGAEQASNNSIPTQVSACHQKALDLGATEIIDFIDAGVPGDLDWTDRPALNNLLDLVEKDHFAGVVVYDPDRLARDLGVQLAVTEMITSKRVRLEFCTQTFDASPEGVLFYQLRGAISQFERAKIRERTNRGRKKLLRDGRPANKPSPYGLSYERSTNTWTIIPHQAEVVRQIFEWTRAGLGPTLICRRLNDQGLLPPRGDQSSRWWTYTIQRMLKSTTYVGRLYLHRYNLEGQRKNRFLPCERRTKASERPQAEWIETPVPPIIDPELWGAVQQILEQNRRRNAGRNSLLHTYLASRLLRCGVCGSAISGATTSRKNGHAHYYRCSGRYGELRLDCNLPHLPAETLDDALWQEVRGWLVQPDRFQSIVEQILTAPPDALYNSRTTINPQMEAVRTDIARLQGLIASGAVREPEVRAALKGLREKEGDLASRLKQPEPVPLPSFAPFQPEVVDAFNPSERQEFIRSLVTEIIVHPDGLLKLTPRVALPRSPASGFPLTHP